MYATPKALGCYHVYRYYRLHHSHGVSKELKTRLETEYAPCAIMAVSAAYPGNMDKSISYLKTAFEDRDPMIILLKHAHWVPVRLRNDDRFNIIMDQIGFPKVTGEI